MDTKPIRKSYSDDFRRQAVAMVVAENIPLAEVARRLGVNPEVLRTWKLKYAPPPAVPGPAEPSLTDEVRRLRELVRQLTMEREILKKSGHLLRQGNDVRFAFVRDHATTWPVRVMCRVLGVTAAGYYAWRDRPRGARATTRASLADPIRTVFAEVKGRYGSPRVYRELVARGIRCTLNTVARVMRALGLAACRRPRPRTAGPAGAAADDTPHVLDREFTATRPNETWVTDITYIRTGEGGRTWPRSRICTPDRSSAGPCRAARTRPWSGEPGTPR